MTVTLDVEGFDEYANARWKRISYALFFARSFGMPTPQQQWGQDLIPVDAETESLADLLQGISAHLVSMLDVHAVTLSTKVPEIKRLIERTALRHKVDLVRTTIVTVHTEHSFMDYGYMYTDHLELQGKTVIILDSPVVGFSGPNTISIAWDRQNVGRNAMQRTLFNKFCLTDGGLLLSDVGGPSAANLRVC